jgi:hypothetical protein
MIILLCGILKNNIMKVRTKPRFIALIALHNKKTIYLNVDMIGDIIQHDGYTVVGHLTHNNGGFKVTQDAEEILDLINK